MKKIEIYSEDQFKNIFDNSDKVKSGDILVIKKKLSLKEDIIVNVPVTIQLEAGEINLNNHLIIQEKLKII
ncbi:MAG: hypothetical protein RSF69_06875 [Erysipelotrichaceae bacterium]